MAGGTAVNSCRYFLPVKPHSAEIVTASGTLLTLKGLNSSRTCRGACEAGFFRMRLPKKGFDGEAAGAAGCSGFLDGPPGVKAVALGLNGLKALALALNFAAPAPGASGLAGILLANAEATGAAGFVTDVLPPAGEATAAGAPPALRAS